MSYPAGMREYRIKVLNRKEAAMGAYGKDSSGVQWEETCCLWASVDWQKGKSAMSAGALDSYVVVMVRMNYTDQISMRSRMVWEGQTYQIIPETFHADKRKNTIQFHAQIVLD